MEGLPKKKPTLPYGWIERISKTFPNRVYYFNTETGASTWIVPFMLKEERDKTRAKLKKRPRSSQERDSGISSTSGGSVSSPLTRYGTAQRTNDNEVIEAEFSPEVSPRSIGDDYEERPDEESNEGPEGGPMWSEFMDSYMRKHDDGFSGDLSNPAPDGGSSFETTISQEKSSKDQLRQEPDLNPGLEDVENSVVTPKQVVEGQPQNFVNQKRSLYELDQIGSNRKVEKVKATPIRYHARTAKLYQPKGSNKANRTGTEQAISGPPRVSVKDRLGWKSYQQEKIRCGDQREGVKSKGRTRRRGRQEKISPQQSEKKEINNNNSIKKGPVSRLLSSWEDVTMGEDEASCLENSTLPRGSGDKDGKPETKRSAKAKTPIQAPPPEEYKGPLTVFSSEDFMDVDQDITSLPNHGPSKKLNIILDTNILLNHLNFVEELRDQHIPGFGRPILIFPWIVLHELDCLKEGKPSDLKDVRGNYKGSLSNKAKSAVTFINSCLINKHPRVQGQSIQECSKKDRGVYTRSNDDKILQCLLQYKNREKSAENVLLTEDMSLRNKAIVSSIHAYSPTDLMDGLKELSKNVSKTLPKSSQKGASGKKVTKSPVENSRNRTRPKTPTVLTESAITDLVDNVICNLRNILRGPLSIVLETEMKSAFGNLWLDIILRKPPWAFLDIIDCIQKHWIAVFSHICGRSAKINFEKIRVFYKVNKGLGANLKITEELLQDALEFLNHLKSHSSYDGGLDVPIARLNGHLQQLNLVQTSSKSPRESEAQAKTSNVKQSPCRSQRTNAVAKVQTVNTASRSLRTKKIVERKSEASATTGKKIKLNRSCWKLKQPVAIPKSTTPTEIAPPQTVTSLSNVAIQGSEEDVAMDTTSEPDISAGNDGDVEMMKQSRTVPPLKGVKEKPCQVGDDDLEQSSTNLPKSSSIADPVDGPSDKEGSPSTPAAMWRQMEKVPPRPGIPSDHRDGNVLPQFPPPVSVESPSSSTTSMMSLASQFSSPPPDSQQPLSMDNNAFVLNVLDMAYKEMYAMCTKVDQSVRQHQSNEYSADGLNLKEALALVEYLIRYIEKQVNAMSKVVTASERNGLMADVSSQIFQELIDVIDGFFIGMEICNSGCGLVPERLKEFLKTEENRESLKRGVYQYQVALHGCQQCYRVISQVSS